MERVVDLEVAEVRLVEAHRLDVVGQLPRERLEQPVLVGDDVDDAHVLVSPDLVEEVFSLPLTVRPRGRIMYRVRDRPHARTRT